MATVNKDFVVKNGVVAGANVQGVQIVSTTSSLPPFTVTSSANVANLSADRLDGQHGSYYLDFSNATNTPDPTIAVYLEGSVSGSGVATLTNLSSASIVLSQTIVNLDSVTLGAETVGDYVESVKAGTGVTVSHTSGESASPTISIGQDVSIGASVTFANITLSQTAGAPIVVSSSALISNLNSQYLNGYTAQQLIGMAGVQSVTGTNNEITVSASTGNVQVGLPDNVTIAGSLTIGENLIVTGSTVVVNSTVVTIDDPVFTIGGDTAGIDDNKDRGIEFKWNNGATAKVGFFGFDESSGKFTFIPDATNSSEVFSGTKGTLDANVEWADILSKPDPTITLGGDLSGNVTLTDLGSGTLTATVEKDFNLVFTGDVTGSGNVANLTSASIALTIANVSVALGTQTTGDYVANIFGTANQVLVAGNGGETASVVLSLPQSIATTSTPTFAGVDLPEGRITSSSATITANSTPTTIDTFAVSSFTTSEYTIRAKQGTKMTVEKILVMWDGTDVSLSEYSIMDAATGAANLTFSATESGGTVTLTGSSPDAVSTNIIIKAVRTAVDA